MALSLAQLLPLPLLVRLEQIKIEIVHCSLNSRITHGFLASRQTLKITQVVEG